MQPALEYAKILQIMQIVCNKCPSVSQRLESRVNVTKTPSHLYNYLHCVYRCKHDYECNRCPSSQIILFSRKMFEICLWNVFSPSINVHTLLNVYFYLNLIVFIRYSSFVSGEKILHVVCKHADIEETSEFHLTILVLRYNWLIS